MFPAGGTHALGDGPASRVSRRRLPVSSLAAVCLICLCQLVSTVDAGCSSEQTLAAARASEVPDTVSGVLFASGSWYIAYGWIIDAFDATTGNTRPITGNSLNIGPPYTDGTGRAVALGRVERLAPLPVSSNGAESLMAVTETQVRHVALSTGTVTTVLSSVAGSTTYVSASTTTLAVLTEGCLRLYPWDIDAVASLDTVTAFPAAGRCNGNGTSPLLWDLTRATGVAVSGEGKYFVTTTVDILYIMVPVDDPFLVAYQTLTLDEISGLTVNPASGEMLVRFEHVCTPGKLYATEGPATGDRSLSLVFPWRMEDGAGCNLQAGATWGPAGDAVMVFTDRVAVTYPDACYDNSGTTPPPTSDGPVPTTSGTPPGETTSSSTTSSPGTTAVPKTRTTRTKTLVPTETTATTSSTPTTPADTGTNIVPTDTTTPVPPTVPPGNNDAALAAEASRDYTMIIALSVTLGVLLAALLTAAIIYAIRRRRITGDPSVDELGQAAPRPAAGEEGTTISRFGEQQQRKPRREKPRLSGFRFPPEEELADEARPPIVVTTATDENPAATAAGDRGDPVFSPRVALEESSREMDTIVVPVPEGTTATPVDTPAAAAAEQPSSPTAARRKEHEEEPTGSLTQGHVQSLSSLPTADAIQRWDAPDPRASAVPLPAATVTPSRTGTPDSRPNLGTVDSSSLRQPVPSSTNLGMRSSMTSGGGGSPRRDGRRRDAKLARWLRNGDFQRTRLVGRGAYGSVYAVLLKDGSAAAMKEMQLLGDEHELQQQMVAFEREVTMLEPLVHRNIVKHFVSTCDREAMVVRVFMELVTGGSLGSMVRGMPTTLPESNAARFTRQIVTALAYIHERHIVHRDLKCDNVLIDAESGEAKLADFGTARVLDRATMRSRAAHTIVGTPFFMAPEILAVKGDQQVTSGAAANGDPEEQKQEEDQEVDMEGYGMKADVWSLGVTVAEMLNRGRPPWPSFPSPAHAFIFIADPSSVPQLPAQLTPMARDFIEQCMRRDPRSRPTAAELLEHPWLQAREHGWTSDATSDEEEGTSTGDHVNGGKDDGADVPDRPLVADSREEENRDRLAQDGDGEPAATVV